MVKEPLPVQEDMPFSLSENVEKGDFDPDAALNISANSNDPGADFLSLMESTNEKRSKERSHGSPDGDFSFSIFGAAVEGSTSNGSEGDFAFDFGNPSQDGGDDVDFQFNFGESSEEQRGSGKDEGFNLFGF
ncbi:unnamed protein product [Strongylus vulgaris]|uniref:Uncharacterized protein n=1 Tax=Strongylus vulgaris TaxID=40348 RepID=A0A3P7L3I1_STRVU|nr:unnamed protein product [Strongylus vulgaris]